ncbi:MAG: molybdopterin-binding protein [Candidatus Bathyarchaeia archaeon]
MKVSAEIFAVGSELCYGRVYDVNSFWLADRLTRIGVYVKRITCIRDDLNYIHATLRDSLNRNPELVITTGGLGPTPDDLTLDALARLTGRELILHQPTLEIFAQKRGVPLKDIPRNIAKMARTLQGARCLPNPTGGAPATLVEVDNTTLIALPGPPREVRAIFARHLKPMFKERTRLVSLHARALVSMRESEISPLIEEIARDNPDLYAKPLVRGYRPGNALPIVLIIFGENRKQCREKLSSVSERLTKMVEEKGRKIVFKNPLTQA